MGGSHQEPHFGDHNLNAPRAESAPVPVDIEADQEAPFAIMPEFNERDLQADTLAFEPVRRRSVTHRSWVWGVIAVVVFAGAIAGWKYWGRDVWAMRNNGDEIPLVHAQDGPFKVRPDQPGGADFANRDMLVYQQLDKNGGGEPKTESLLPQPEKPLPPPAPRPPAQTNQPHMTPQEAAADPMSQEGGPMSVTGGEGQGEETEDDGPTEVATPQAVPPQPPDAAVKIAPPPAAAPTSVATTTSLRPSPEQVRAAQPPAPAPAPPAVKAEQGTPSSTASAAPQANANSRAYRIQISAVRSEADARNEWVRLRKQYEPVLGKLTLFVERADLGTKGVFYRIQAGGFSDKPAAESACQQLAKQKVGCLVVRPEG
jgi:cell division septation protein DedD